MHFLQAILFLPLRHFGVRITSYNILLLILDLESKNTPCTKFEQDQANILANMQVSSLFYSATHSKQKVAMEIPEIDENGHYVQNDPHRCKIKLEKFHFDHNLCFFGEKPC